ncbi:AAA family ATPase [Pelotomaculum propionicicum]|uniref:Protein CR006 P-loop domain-containing protein n=1 Tax=Pelotomaculum propionicicum TaxID=258475 RepID=A0A4Y7RBI0_9FIRM|nr:AAA family ATPase [Pelotomaculum propionicicum]NLI14099.1 AAA family ATPase [Peptococcaceae bacterium]TEB06368.1 hypothetical protein Pmgp_03766 [Pelotomaculum propionicicum]
MAVGFTVKLDVNNFGPHYGDKKIAFSDEVDSNKAIFFATNGTGKSFISRAFRLTSTEKQTELADDLLTLGQASGSLSFRIINAGIERKLSVSVEKGKTPSIQNNTGLLFHVFNSDFVEENIKPRHYTPDGNIEGYILGKTQIDLTAEREREKKLKEELGSIGKEIDAEVNKAKRELRDQGVLPSTKEFSLIEEGRLRGDEQVGSVASFDEIVAQLDALSKVPEKLDDVQSPTLKVDQSVFGEIITLLTTKYPKTEWDEEFVAGIKANRAFIEKGLALSGDENVCPFCKQPYGTDALALIRDYKAYLADKEAELLRKIELCGKGISGIVDSLKGSTQSTKTAVADITSLKKYFPSLAEVELEIPEVSDDGILSFKAIIEMLDDKAADLSKTFPTINDTISTCKTAIKVVEDAITHNTQTIKAVNKTKQDSTGERLSLRRNLCKAQFLKYRAKLKPRFSEYDDESKALRELQASIVEKEQKVRISKRDKVYETMTFFLNRFFTDKYSIDKDTFQIRFLGSNVGDKASSILSDGEKSIVAFCFYLSSTHILMEREDDYNKLFFVIDDPISSMDFHYVYAVAQSLRDIKAFFGITTHERIWVFTHNMEFLSIIARNYIISKAYVMKPGSIEVLKHQLLMPYESHLKDIVETANGSQQPSHTTANSIRHVLETVSRFEYPERSIEKYIAENSILSQDSCIFTLCQDLSHGGIRIQQSFSAEILVAACKTVVAFMNSKYEGQVKAIPVMATNTDHINNT